MTEQDTNNTVELEPQPKTIIQENAHKSMTIGLVGNYADTDETRFLLTPEG